MKKILTTSLIFAVAFLFTGCREWLEPSSSDEYVPETAASLDEMLVGEAYPTGPGSGVDLFVFHNILDDDIKITDEPVGMVPNSEAIQTEILQAIFTWQSDMFTLMGDYPQLISSWVWDDYYERILGANAALDYVDDANDTQEMKDFVKAQALGLRAFYYFNLVNLFSQPYNYDRTAPGVPLKLTSDLSTSFTDRGTVEGVYNQILKDFDESERLFLSLPENRQFSENYRINLPTVQLLKARVYLFMEDWENAVRMADSVLRYPQFTLYDLTQFTASASNPKPHFSNYDNGETMWHYGEMYDIYSFANMTGYPEEGTDYRKLFNASDELLAAFPEEDSLRRNLYIFDEYSDTTLMGNKLAMGKVMCDAQCNLSNASGFAMSVRLSEAYLILAEAHAMLGNSAEALNYLNTLRAHRIPSYTEVSGISGDELIQFVREERRRELCFEGFRWFDLRRWGMESFSHSWKLYDNEPQRYVLEKNDPGFTLPIPQEVINRNPGLTQNTLAGERNPM